MTTPLGSRARRVAELEADEAILGELRALLDAEGIHHHYVRTKVLGVLVTAAEMAGDKAKARQLVQMKLELARAHDAAHRSR